LHRDCPTATTSAASTGRSGAILRKRRWQIIFRHRKAQKSNDQTSNESESKNDFYKGDSNITEASSFENTSLERISVTTSNYLPDQTIIMSGGLNYKIIRVGEEERKMIEMLREKINIATDYQRNN